MRRHTLAVISATLPFLGGVGCSTNVGRTPPPAGKAVAPARPVKNEDADDPLVKEARPDTAAILNEMLTGTTRDDPGLALRAQQVRRYTSWSIEGQEVESRRDPKSVRFDGTLAGPSGHATFSVSMVKQQNGRWMVGWFSGPNPR